MAHQILQRKHDKQSPVEVGVKKEIGIKFMDLLLRGRKGAPLVIHAFAEKAKQEIRDKQQKKAKRVKAERNPQEESDAARYVDDKGRECAPITAIKKSIISAATAFDDITKVGIRQSIFVDCLVNPGSPLVPIERHDGSPAKGVCRNGWIGVWDAIVSAVTKSPRVTVNREHIITFYVNGSEIKTQSISLIAFKEDTNGK
jgi:hypothetical protein